jgi:hypothetical protein
MQANGGDVAVTPVVTGVTATLVVIDVADSAGVQ